MREIEFKKLVVGDIVYNPAFEDQPWTVVAPYRKGEEKTFLLLYGRHQLSESKKRIWLIMAMLSDDLCLNFAASRDLRIALIYDPSKWVKENKPS